MSRNHKELFNKVKKTTKRLMDQGYSARESKELVFMVLEPLQSEIDSDNVFNALVRLNSL